MAPPDDKKSRVEKTGGEIRDGVGGQKREISSSVEDISALFHSQICRHRQKKTKKRTLGGPSPAIFLGCFLSAMLAANEIISAILPSRVVESAAVIDLLQP